MCTKLKNNENELFRFCVQFEEIPFIYDADNNNASTVLYAENKIE